MIHLSLDNSPYIERDTGKPVEGRMSVFLHGSNNLATVYTLEGTEFVRAANPQLLHGGLPEHSLFVETGLYDIAVDSYIGEAGAMSAQSPDSDFARIDLFEEGIDFDLESLTANQVDNLEGLRTADTSLGVVRVLWYERPGDCPARNYIWDSASQNEEDGGYVVGSDLSDTGRWILLWDGEDLPCTVYGVTPGNEGNMNLLLSYPSVVGSFLQHTAPAVRFVPGTYTSGITYSTTKELRFDRGATFPGSVFVCPSVRMVGGTAGTPVADFSFTDSSAVAHSSWFRSAEWFLACGAGTLVIDPGTSFVTPTVGHPMAISAATIIGNGRLPVTYSVGASITLSGTAVSGRIFNPALDYVILDSSYGDSVFTSGTWDPGTIASGHHVQYMGVPELHDFSSVSRWYMAINEMRGRRPTVVPSTLDFCGRECTARIYGTNWTWIRNVNATGGITVDGDITLSDVTGTVYVNSQAAGGAALTLRNCTVTLPDDYVGLSHFVSNDSSIAVTGQRGLDPAAMQISVYGGTFSGYVKMTDAELLSYSRCNTVDFKRVTFTTMFTWKLNRLSMEECNGPVGIDLYPYRDGDSFLYSLNLVGNTFAGASRAWLTVAATSAEPHQELDGHVSFGFMRIVGNVFGTSDSRGIRMLKWHPYTGNRLVSTDVGSWEYHGNSGICPRLSPGAVDNAGHWDGIVTSGGIRWRHYDTPMSIWAPYAYFLDGMVNEGKDPTGLCVSPSSGSIAMLMNGVQALGGEPRALTCGYRTALDTPVGDSAWDPDLNDMFWVYPAITTGAEPVITPTGGFTFWYATAAV